MRPHRLIRTATAVALTGALSSAAAFPALAADHDAALAALEAAQAQVQQAADALAGADARVATEVEELDRRRATFAEAEAARVEVRLRGTEVRDEARELREELAELQQVLGPELVRIGPLERAARGYALVPNATLDRDDVTTPPLSEEDVIELREEHARIVEEQLETAEHRAELREEAAERRLVATAARRARAEARARVDALRSDRAELAQDLAEARASAESAQAALDEFVVLPAEWRDHPTPAWANRLPAAGQEWAVAIDAAAQEAGVDPLLLAALIWQESQFDPRAQSHVGAYGLTQLMPATADELGVDPAEPVENLRGGARYIRQQLDAFGDPTLALAAYNAGAGNVQRYGGVPPFEETRTYVVRIASYRAQLAG